MKKIVVVLLVALATSCSSTPADLRASDRHFITRTSLAPDVAARCLLGRLEAQSTQLRGRVMPLGEGRYELLVWQTIDWGLFTDHDSRLLAEIGPGDLGVTQIDSWFAWDILNIETGSGDQVVQGLLKGC